MSDAWSLRAAELRKAGELRGSRTVIGPPEAGHSICRLANGLWQIGDMEREGGIGVNEAAAQRDLDAYVQCGQTTFDMADHYGSAEEIMGRYHMTAEGPATECLTKWCPKPKTTSRQGLFDETDAAVALAKDRLQVGSIFLLQYHGNPVPLALGLGNHSNHTACTSAASS